MTVRTLTALVRIPIDKVDAGPNARGHVGDVGDLAQSIKTLGMQEPLLVVQLAEDRYQVLDGHRRLAAARSLGAATVDAVLRREAGPAVRLQQQLAIHTQAKSFDPIAEARGLHELMWVHNMTREDIARSVGRSPGWVRDRIGLLQLTPDEQQSVSEGRLPLNQALLVAKGRRGYQVGPDTGRPITAQARPARHCPTCACQGRV